MSSLPSLTCHSDYTTQCHMLLHYATNINRHCSMILLFLRVMLVYLHLPSEKAQGDGVYIGFTSVSGAALRSFRSMYDATAPAMGKSNGNGALTWPHLSLRGGLLKCGGCCGTGQGVIHTCLLLCLYPQLTLWLCLGLGPTLCLAI